jgi:putative membrane protein
MSDRRFPRWVFDHGTEPDPRFTLANERTFLAWTRTSLAFIAGGVALEAVDVPLSSALKLAVAVILLALGLLLPITAWAGWALTERAMRRAEPLPASLPTLVVVCGAVVAAALLLLGFLTR